MQTPSTMGDSVFVAGLESFCGFLSQSSRSHFTNRPKNRTLLNSCPCEIDYLFYCVYSQAIALLAGLCFHGVLGTRDQKTIQNIQGALFILTTENTFPALYGALGIFPMEWPLFLRDARGGLYSPSAYYLSKVVALV